MNNVHLERLNMSTKHLAAAVILFSCCVAMGQASAPASRPASQPVVDLLKGAIDPYDAVSERNRFLTAAGVDNELDEKEFNADRQKASPFARAFDQWGDILKHDINGNKTIDWFEADAYRQGLRKRLVAAFDTNKDGKLAGDERLLASAALAGGDIRQVAGRPTSGPAGNVAWGRGGDDNNRWRGGGGFGGGGGMSGSTLGNDPNDPAPYYSPDYRALMKEYDADGDGKMSADEWNPLNQHVTEERQKWELAHYDTDRDGKISDDERAAMQKEATDWGKRRMERYNKDMLAKYDADGDGKVSDEERRAMWTDQMRQFEKANWEQYKKWDADGDGELSGEERKTMQQELSRQMEKANWKYFEKYDADGDGELSDDERTAMREDQRRQMEKAQAEMVKKYDADGDGKLSDDERRTMMEEIQKQWRGRSASRPTGS